MQLDSALELQAELLRSTGPRAGLAAQSAREGAPARRRRRIVMQPDLALGVAPTAAGDFQLAVRVQRRALLGSSRIQAIVDRAQGEVDIRYVGRVEKLQGHPDLRARHRPLIAGASVGHIDITAGTLGAFATDAEGRSGILSNNHVLADENRADIGDAIVQPARSDGGEPPEDVVAHLAEFVPIAADGINRLDAAFARLADGIELDAAGSLGPLGVGVVEPVDADRVRKLGRTSGLTLGRVSAFNVSNVVVEYEISPAVRFDGQIEIQALDGGDFSLGGDSGSLIVDDDLVPVGLLFAGSDQGADDGGPVTFANPIGEVLAGLDIELYRDP